MYGRCGETGEGPEAGGERYKEFMVAYKNKCQSLGHGSSRGSFDWIRFSKIYEKASVSQDGTKGVWMGQAKYLKHMQTEWDMSKHAALGRWTGRMQKAGKQASTQRTIRQASRQTD